MRILKIALKIVLAATLFTLVTMLLWNWLVPDIFKGPTINYVQAFGLIVLSRVLFFSFGRGFGSPRWGRHGHWRKFRESYDKMSDEEKAEWNKKYCGHWMHEPSKQSEAKA